MLGLVVLGVRPINTRMKISEFINVPKESKDTTSCGTTYSGQKADPAQDIVPQDIVPENIRHWRLTAKLNHIQTTPQSQKGSARSSGDRKARSPPRVSDAHQVPGRVVSLPSPAPVSQRRILSSRPRSGRRDSRRPR